MEVNDMRVWVARAYSSPNWKKRVSHMSDAQIMAIYFRMRDAAQKG